jgi:hypothetical protein
VIFETGRLDFRQLRPENFKYFLSGIVVAVDAERLAEVLEEDGSVKTQKLKNSFGWVRLVRDRPDSFEATLLLNLNEIFKTEVIIFEDRRRNVFEIRRTNINVIKLFFFDADTPGERAWVYCHWQAFTANSIICSLRREHSSSAPLWQAAASIASIMLLQPSSYADWQTAWMKNA